MVILKDFSIHDICTTNSLYTKVAGKRKKKYNLIK